jgi:hypothetical protein
MDSFQAWLHRTINSERYGGRTVRTDEQTVVLYDYGTWTEGHSRAVRAKFPECDIAITQCQASLSGFIVLFKLKRDRSLYAWITATAVVLALVLLTARQMALSQAL